MSQSAGDREQPHVRKLTSQLRLSFEPNRGQAPAGIDFVSRSRAYSVYVNDEGLTVMPRIEPAGAAPADGPIPRGFSLRFPGCNRSTKLDASDIQPGVSNYIVGSDSKKWLTDIPNYGKVEYRNLYDGISMVLYGRSDQLEYDFAVSPGANPRSIRFTIDGEGQPEIDGAGDLVIKSSAGEFHQRKPVVYQEVGARRKETPSRYVIHRKRAGQYEIGIKVGRYDRRRTLVIDPVLTYARYIGGSRYESGRGVAMDAQGNAYIVGLTGSNDFLINQSPALDDNLFLMKLDPNGTMVFTTVILGGSGDATGVAVDASGFIYVTGHTLSNSFPSFSAAQPRCALDSQGICSDAFVFKMAPDGISFVYSTYLGGSGHEFASGIAVDQTGAAYVTGSTSSADFPVSNAFQGNHHGPLALDGDAFVTKISPSGSSFMYSSFLGGAGNERATGIAVDASGNAYVTGFTNSGSFPALNAFQVTPRNAAYESTNGGSSWMPIESFTASNLTALAIDPNNSSTLYAGSDVGRFYKSTDAGTTWRQMPSDLQMFDTVNSIAVDAANSSVVVAAASIGVLKTTDGGTSWRRAGVINDGFNVRPLSNVRAIAFDPQTSSTIYATTNSSALAGFVKSTDGGATWKSASTGVGARNSLAINPRNTSVIISGDSKSTDAGLSFNRTFFFAGAASVAFDPTRPSRVYLGAALGVYKSTDQGDTWALASPQGQVQAVGAIAIDPRDPNIIYAGGVGGVSRSTDGGATWSQAKQGMTTERINALAISPSTSKLYAGAMIPYDAFVAKLNTSGLGLIYSTSLGGTQDDVGYAIAVDPAGDALIAGIAISADFPVVNALQPNFGGEADAFVAKFDPTGSVVFSTFLGGRDIDEAFAIATDSAGYAYIAGDTESSNFPLTNPVQPNLGGGPGTIGDAFVLKLSPAGNGVVYSTYLGGSDSDRALAIAAGPGGSAVIAGETYSTNFPLAGASVTSYHGGRDAFVARITDPTPITPGLVLLSSIAPSSAQPGSELTYTFTVTNIGPAAVGSVTVTDDLPRGVDLVSCSASRGGSCGGSGNSRIVGFDSLPPGGSAIITVVARVNCSAPSGSLVNHVTAAPSGLGIVSAESVVTVTNHAPVITCPRFGAIHVSSPGGAVVGYQLPGVTDDCPGASVVCSPPSGAVFAVGTTTVSCTATDSGGATAACSFEITLTTANVPVIESASLSGKKLIVTGHGFDDGAVVLVNAEEQKTRNDSSAPSSMLVAKKAGKRIPEDQPVPLQVRNPSGISSLAFPFRRSP
jgi:uncharacterized repeat protein (TIGR01451 family)